MSSSRAMPIAWSSFLASNFLPSHSANSARKAPGGTCSVARDTDSLGEIMAYSGRYDEAILHLRLVRDEDPDNDHAHYMLAVAHAQRAEHAEAIAHLERAIALNPENRSLARRDPDLEVLRGDDAFRAALESAPVAPMDRGVRRPLRPKLAR